MTIFAPVLQCRDYKYERKYQSQWDYREDRRRYGLCQDHPTIGLLRMPCEKYVYGIREQRKDHRGSGQLWKIPYKWRSPVMRTKFTGAAGRTSCICFSAHHSFCGYCNRYKYAMGRNHKRVNRITALSSLLLHIILFTRQTEKAIHIYFEKT